MADNNKNWGIIFDLDGTLLNNNPFHLKAWQALCRKHGKELTDEDYKTNMSGKNNNDSMKYLFGTDLSQESLNAFKEEKEELYRELYRPHAKPVEGAEALIKSLIAEEIPIALATSATPVNIVFTLEALNFTDYFKTVVDSTQISRGKPDPEIYLTAADRININPAACIVFEDSLTGVQGAKAAGMKVIGMTTSHSPEELSKADKTINNFLAVSINELTQMIHA